MLENFRMFVELFFNLFQGIAFVMFCYFFLGGKFDKKKNKIIAAAEIIVMFAAITVQNYLTFFTIEFSELILYISIMIPYSVFFLKGKLYLRILVPIIAYVILSGLALTFECLCMAIFNVKWNDITQENHYVRYFMNTVINMIFVLVLFLIIKFKSNRVNLSSSFDIAIFLILPVLGMTVIFLSFLVSTNTAITKNELIMLAAISIITFIYTIIVLYAMFKISKISALKAQNLVLEKEQQLYEQETKNSNEYIKQISTIKHDMKNNLLCVEELIKRGQVNEAVAICNTAGKELADVVVFRTENIYLNSILNVITKKTHEKEIDFKVEVKSELNKVKGTDLIAIVGNLCDNAIEYVCDKKQRRIWLTTETKGSYYIIIVRNTITTSVLMRNPDLISKKDDKRLHGFGILSVKRIAQLYNGDIDFTEDNGVFVSKVMLGIPNIT